MSGNVASTSFHRDYLWTSDALVFLQALPLHHPVAILVRDDVSSTRDNVGSGSKSTISWTCRLINMVQHWRKEGVEHRSLAVQLHRATNIGLAAMDIVSTRPDLEFDSTAPNYLHQLGAALQHADPSLEAWNEQPGPGHFCDQKHSTNPTSSSTQSAHSAQPTHSIHSTHSTRCPINDTLCMPMRMAVDAMQHLINTTPIGDRIDFSLLNVTAVGGVSSSLSCVDLGVCMNVMASDAQRCAQTFQTSSAVHLPGILLIDGNCTSDSIQQQLRCKKFGISSTTTVSNAAELTKMYAKGGRTFQELDQLVQVFCQCFQSKGGLILVCGKVAPHVIHACSANRVLVVPHVRFGDLEAVARTNDAQLVGDPWTCCSDDIGHPVKIETKSRGWMAPEDAPSMETGVSYSGADANASMRARSVHLVVVPLLSRLDEGTKEGGGGNGKEKSKCTSSSASASTSGRRKPSQVPLPRDIPISVILCSRIPVLLDDVGVRFWKYMHRLRHALELSGLETSQEDGQDLVESYSGTPLDTVLPGGGVPEAVAIVALQQAAAAAAAKPSTMEHSKCNTLMDADVFLAFAQMLKEHLLCVIMNSGMLLEESTSALGEYLCKVKAIVGGVIVPTDGRDEVRGWGQDRQNQPSKWQALRHSMPLPILLEAFQMNSNITVLDVKKVVIESLKSATRTACLTAAMGHCVTHFPQGHK